VDERLLNEKIEQRKREREREKKEEGIIIFAL